jgi:hypothetical protein
MRRETDRNTIKILYSNGNTSIVTQNWNMAEDEERRKQDLCHRYQIS